MDGNSSQLFYQSALNGLETGILMPWDRQLLSVSPLPDSVIEPFTTKEMPDVLSSMKMTYDAMVIWIEEAKKINYFSKRFVQLSRMVMNGVTTMARGLITLHGRGEDLNESPMSIKDLLDVASYHFRKSYLGVLQTSRSHPEIGERLLMNQIGWNNILMRLFKTRDKLAAPVKAAVCNAKSESIESSESRDCLNTSVQSGKDEAVKALPASDSRAYSAPSAFAEPGAYSAPRAFSSYDKASSGSGKKNPAVVQKNEMTEENPDERKEIEKKIEKVETSDSLTEKVKTARKSGESDEQSGQPETDERTQANPETAEKGNPAEADEKIHENPDPQESGTGDQEVPEESGEHLSEGNPVEEPIAALEPDPPDSLSPGPDGSIPGYLKILQDIYARSDDSDSGTFTMSFDEIRYLASDPEFGLIYPEAAAEMKSLMQNMDSS